MLKLEQTAHAANGMTSECFFSRSNKRGVFQYKSIDTAVNVADILTKSLPEKKVELFRSILLGTSDLPR